MEKGWGNSRTLPLVSSDTQRFPDRSNAKESGKPRQPAPPEMQKKLETELRSFTPRARLVLSPIESGELYLKTLPACESPTQRFPDESNATATGPFRLVGDVCAEQLSGHPCWNFFD